MVEEQMKIKELYLCDILFNIFFIYHIISIFLLILSTNILNW
jgi:hypothetical protein